MAKKEKDGSWIMRFLGGTVIAFAIFSGLFLFTLMTGAS